MTERSISRLTAVSSQRRSSSVAPFFGARRGTMNVAKSSVTTMTPHARKMTRSRWGKGVTVPASVGRYRGMVNMTASVMVPFGPASAIVSAERASASQLGRSPFALERPWTRSTPSSHRKRTAR